MSVTAAAAVVPLPASSRLRGLLIAIAGAVLFSGKAVLVKLLYGQGVDPVTVIALRLLLSAPFFLAMALWTWRDEPRLSARDYLVITVLGLVGYYGSSMLDFLGLQYISVGLERLILFLTPSFVLLMGWRLFGKPVRGSQWVSLAIAYAGIVLVFGHDVQLGGPTVGWGALLVMGGAVAYAVYLLLSGELVARVGSMRLVALAMLASAAAGLIQYGLLRPWPALFEQSAEVWKLSLLNATTGTVMPVLLTMAAVRRLGAGMTAQIGMVGPVSTLFLGNWVLGEPIGGLQLAGTALVLIGIGVLSRTPASRG